MTSYQDPLDSAENPEIQLPRYYGQVLMDAFFCILQKGVGKVPFDPAQHSLDKRNTAIKLGIIPLPEQNVTRAIEREYIAEFGAWPKITLPSIKAVGLTVRQLNGAWVCLELVQEGRTYTDKNGQTQDSLTFKVTAHYADEAACRAAYLAQTVNSGQEPGNPVVQTAPATAPTNGNGHNGNGNGANPKERETALQFVKVLIGQVHGDEAQLGKRIAAMPMLAKYFTVESPEVRTALDIWHFEQLGQAG